MVPGGTGGGEKGGGTKPGGAGDGGGDGPGGGGDGLGGGGVGGEARGNDAAMLPSLSSLCAFVPSCCCCPTTRVFAFLFSPPRRLHLFARVFVRLPVQRLVPGSSTPARDTRRRG